MKNAALVPRFSGGLCFNMQSSLRLANYRAVLELDQETPGARYAAAMTGLHLAVTQCGWPEGVLVAQSLRLERETPAVAASRHELVFSHPESLAAALAGGGLPREAAAAGPAA